MKTSKARARGAFTLLELLVVVAILAVLGGALLVSYDGLEEDAASAHSGFNISASDRAVRTFSTLNNTFPDEWDSLLTGDPSTSPFVADPPIPLVTPYTGLDRLHSDLASQLLTASLNSTHISALNAIGITTVRDIDTNFYTNDGDFTNDNVSVPNRIFDDNGTGPGYYGAVRAFVDLDEFAYINPTSSLQTQLGLAFNDVAVVLGLGNNNTIHDKANSGALSQTPFGRVKKGQYGRFIAAFQIIENGTDLSKARFVGMIDAKGKVLDEAIADFTEGNN